MGFFKVLPLQSWQGFGAFWKRTVVFLLPLCLYVLPSLDDLHLILLYFLWFMFAASNYSFSFGKHYHPVLLHSRLPCLLFRTIRPFPLLAMVSFPPCFEGKEGVRGCAVLEVPLWVCTWVGSALRIDSRANREPWCCWMDLGLVTLDSVHYYLCLWSLQVKSCPCENQWQKSCLFPLFYPLWYSCWYPLSFLLSVCLPCCMYKDSLYLIFPMQLRRLREESYPH